MLVFMLCFCGNFLNVSRFFTIWIACSKYWIIFVISYSFTCSMTLEFTITGRTILFGIIPIRTSYFTCCWKFIERRAWFRTVNNFFDLFNLVIASFYWFILYHVLRGYFVSPLHCFVASYSYTIHTSKTFLIL